MPEPRPFAADLLVNMPSQRPVFVVLCALLALTVLAPVAIWMKSRQLEATRARFEAAVRNAPGSGGSGRGADRRLGVAAGLPTARAGAGGSGAGAAESALTPLGRQIRGLLGADPATARPGEVLVVFATMAAYQDFLGTVLPAGWPVVGRIPELAALRLAPGPSLGETSIASLVRALEPFAGDLAGVAANPRMFLALPTDAEAAPAMPAGSPAELLGIPGQAFGLDQAGRRGAAWGRDFMIALLDTGVAPAVVAERTFRDRDPTLVGTLDAGWGSEPVDVHGSSAAAVLSWVAPGARLVGVRVTDDEGVSDVFSVAQGIVSAVNVGANLLAISPVSPEPALLLDRAVGLATGRGVAVVASTGGDVTSWPAADPRVIAVGSIVAPRSDAASGAMPQLALDQMMLDAAASAAVVAGALADVMSVYPGTASADAWLSLQSMAGEPTAERSPLAAQLYGAGLQVLNLRWVGLPVAGAGERRGAAGGPGFAAGARGGARAGRAGAPSPGRVVVGPASPSRRAGVGPTQRNANLGAGAGRTVPLTQSDRTVRGNEVPIGATGRGNTR
jgi:hypothetical protein